MNIHYDTSISTKIEHLELHKLNVNKNLNEKFELQRTLQIEIDFYGK